MSNVETSTRSATLADLAGASTMLGMAIEEARESCGAARQLKSEFQAPASSSKDRSEAMIERINAEKKVRYAAAILQAYEALQTLSCEISPVFDALQGDTEADDFIENALLKLNRDQARRRIVDALGILGQHYHTFVDLRVVMDCFGGDLNGAHAADIRLARDVLMARAIGAWAIKHDREDYVAIQLTNLGVEQYAAAEASELLQNEGWEASVQDHFQQMCLILSRRA